MPLFDNVLANLGLKARGSGMEEALLKNQSEDINKLNKALYTHWYSPFMPITNTRSLTGDLANGYMDNDSVYSIINKIADTAANIPLMLVDAEGEKIKNHPLNDILINPNPDNSLRDIIFNYYVYLLSIGNSFIYSPTLTSGNRTELWTMPSDIVEVVSGPWYQPIIGYKTMEGNQEILFEKDTVMHGKLFNPRFLAGSWVYGLSPISVAAEIIRTLNAGEISMEAAYTNMGPPYIISSQTPEGLDEEQQEQLEDTYDRKYGDPTKTGKPMLTGTPVDVKMLGISPVDLNVIEGSEHGLRVLCNVYGVSSILFNDNANSTYNNISQARKDFYDYTVIPLNAAFAAKLKNFLLSGETNVFLKFDYSDVEVLQEGFKTKLDALQNVTFLTDNEKREKVGYAPIDGGDELPTAKVAEPVPDVSETLPKEKDI